MTRILATFAAAALVLSGCSSSSAEKEAQFCEAAEAWAEAMVDFGGEIESTFGALELVEGLGSAEDVAALNAGGQEILDVVAAAEREANKAKAAADEPAVKDALDRINQLMTNAGNTIGEAARDAESILGFAADLSADVDLFAELAAIEDDPAIRTLDDYTQEHCGDLEAPSNSARAQDTAAKADVSKLGIEIMVYFVDNTSTANAEVTVVGDTYMLNGENIGSPSENVTITNQWVVDGQNWCIEVTNPKGAEKVFRYSYDGGLEQGPCPENPQG